MSDEPPFPVPEPAFQKGEQVWLHPDKGKPHIRHLCRITKVHRYGKWGQTVYYDTDYEYTATDTGRLCKAAGLSAHWMRPISAIDRLAGLVT